ncbi:proline dehydrogenase family protein [Planomicrobium sp. CPCC 101079]|uniref:proline dehydrogenase family protein n=1 Tax=Planomicrobium sp. CPCC 101079 TaxID=2599618 RepID=UPI0011B857DD|nr:proline dehydrogenase family protein [Planomicrobium sp. CPCC 101079]TWT01551.1 proline dehydrogenase [Planomicrobium sp. CPCC 101079]
MSALSSTFQTLAKNKTANKMALRYGMRFGASRFVAGEKEEEAIECVKKLNSKGLHAMLNYLGEYVFTTEAAENATVHCLRTLEMIHRHNLQSNLSVKISSLGVDISKEVCLANLRRILDQAKKYGIFLRIEMEDFSHCQVTLDIYKELRKEYDNVGTVLQAYLYRTLDDIDDLNQYNANLRLVKGAYKETSAVAYQDKAKVDQNYLEMIKKHLANGNYAGIATHDDSMVAEILHFVQDRGISKDQFEFQMLHGIREDMQTDLAQKGYKVRVYVPYGVDWFGYFMRRLAERPENVTFVLRNLMK